MMESIGHDGYRVLALETRPQTLDALVGQDNVRRVLSDLIEKKRLPHALLLTGTRGTGKTSTARIFAKSLCCESGPTSTPCGTCSHCLAITASAHEDVMEIDGASNTGVDQIRELRESARFYPKSARYKIFIIDEVHMLSIGAFNALLKTLEEPPPQVLFVLATTEVNKVPATVRSRCMILPFRKADVSTLASHMAEVLKLRATTAELEALVLIAREGRGSFRDSLSLLEQALPYAENGHLTRDAVSEAFGLQDRELAWRLVLALFARDIEDGLGAIDLADQMGFDFGRLYQQVSEFIRHALILKVCSGHAGPNRDGASALTGDLLESERNELLSASASLSQLALAEAFRIIQQACSDISRATQQRPWAEVAFLDCLDRSVWMESQALLEALSSQAAAPKQASEASPGQPMNTAPQHAEHKNPAPSRETTEGSQTHRSHPTAAAHGKLDHGLLRKWIELVSHRSVPLGAKLRHAQFEVFTRTEVRLIANDANQIYGRISEVDRSILLEALVSLGVEVKQLEGFTVVGEPGSNRAGARGADSKKKP